MLFPQVAEQTELDLLLLKLGAKVTLVGPSTLVPRSFERMGVTVTHRIDDVLESADVVNLLRVQHERQRKEVRSGSDDGSAHDRCSDIDGTSILNVRPLHFQRHIFESMKLQKAFDIAIVAKTDCVPIEALHGLRHDRAAADPASEHIEDRARYCSSGKESQRFSAPHKETILRKKVCKVSQ